MITLSMKSTRRGIVIFLAIIAIILFSNLPNAIAGDYLGEFCWLYQQTENAQGAVTKAPVLVRFGVTSMGNNYYTLQGSTVQVTDDNPAIFGGTAVIIGNDVFLTMETSQQHLTKPYRDSGVGQAHLALETLSGTFWGNAMNFDTQARVTGTFYSAGTMTFTTCP